MIKTGEIFIKSFFFSTAFLYFIKVHSELKRMCFHQVLHQYILVYIYNLGKLQANSTNGRITNSWKWCYLKEHESKAFLFIQEIFKTIQLHIFFKLSCPSVCLSSSMHERIS